MRTDTCGVLEWYLRMVYNRLGVLMRSNNQKVDPLVDLANLQEFWASYHDGQDVTIMCLEI